MSRLNLLKEGKSYTFGSYFELPYETDEILAEFGVGFSSEELPLPRAKVASSIAESMGRELRGRLKRVRLSSETARREALVSPILFNVAELSDSQLRIEYVLTVNDQLKGRLDYLIKGKQNLLVIEAKNDDITRGFTQLAVELIAFSRQESTYATLYGAVTTGDVWVFGRLDVRTQTVIQDLSRYRVPEDVQEVMEILTGILTAD